MNKLELTETLREKTDLTKSEAKAVVKLFFKEIVTLKEKNSQFNYKCLRYFI